MAKLRAIIFDLGETLLNYGKVDIDSLFAKAAELTYDYLQGLNTGGKLPPFRWYRTGNIAAIKLHYFWSNIIRREFDCLALLNRRVTRMGFRLSAEQLTELAWRWYEPLGDSATIEPTLHETLATLRDIPLKLAIISNTFLPGEVLDRHLGSLGILEFFETRVYSSATRYRKPHRRIFETALEQLNVPASAVVMIGDHIRNDIIGPQRLGMSAIFKRATLNSKSCVTVPEIDSIAELPDIIGNWDNH